MADGHPSPTRVLVVRAWTESDGSLRIRVSGQLEPGADPAFHRLAADPDAAAAAVREWLDTFRPAR